MKQIYADKKWYVSIFPCLISIFGWIQLELSCSWDDKQSFWNMSGKYIGLNILTILVINLILLMICNRIWLSTLLGEILCCVLSIINYFVIKFHGLPFSVMEIKNTKAAIDVMQGYDIKINACISIILVIFAVSFVLILFVKKEEKNSVKTKKNIFKRDAIIVLAAVCVFYFGYFSANPVKPKKTIGWSWKEAYFQYGYTACSIEMIISTRNVVNKPEGYSLEKVENINIEENEQQRVNQTPDVILILNETFYDLKMITDIETDHEYMSGIKSLDNSVHGYAVVPLPGGGTNCSEYEFLTSNSLQLMPGVTPFNVLDLKNANTVVSHMKNLGYRTLGAHGSGALSYSRNRAYPDIGFDRIYFMEDFENIEYYGERWYATDLSLYNNMINWYDNNSEDPQFMYLLTMQNHGGWDMNNPEKDTVHVLNDYGEYTDQINEYLTSIKLSDEAFMYLVNYFKTIDRPVVICMVGDHSPAFAKDIVDKKYENDKKIRLRETPFIIWSNQKIDETTQETISMNYLVPLIFEKMGIKESSYYTYMNQLREDIPILTSYGDYYDSKGNEYSYDEESVYTDRVNNYFYLEYNNLNKKQIKEIFE